MSRFYRAAWIFYLLLAMGGLVGLVALERRIELALFFAPDGWWLDLGLGIATGGALLAFWTFVRRFSERARELERTLGALVGPLATEEVVSLAVVSAIGEEVAFRGALQGWLGLVPAAIFFTLLHVGPGPTFRPWTLFAAVGGFAFGGLVLWRGSLGGAIVAHLVVNAVQLRRIARLAPAPPPEGEAAREGP